MADNVKNMINEVSINMSFKYTIHFNSYVVAINLN